MIGLNNMKNKIIIAVVVLVVGVGAFYSGVNYGKAQIPTRSAVGQFGSGQNGSRGARGNGFVAGEILSKDATSITLKLTTGGSKIVFTTASTTVSKSTSGTLSDLDTGANVTIQGVANSDGSVTAQSVQIRPAGMMQGSGNRNQP